MDEIINKSLDDIDATIENLSKARDDEDIAPNEVSDDSAAPEATDEAQEGEAEAGDVDTDTEGEENEQEDEEVEKSLSGVLGENENVKKALEVSEFLDSLVKGMDAILAGHNDSLSKSIASTEKSQELLAKSFAGIVKSQQAVMEALADIVKSQRTLSKRLKAVEEQPMVRKSLPAVNAAKPMHVVEKSFAGIPASNGVQMTRAQQIDTLMKSYQSGNMALGNDIMALEAYGDINVLSSEAKQLLNIN